MQARHLALALSLTFAAHVALLMRRGRLRELHALIWLGAGAAMSLLAWRPRWLDSVGQILGVAYPPAFFLLLGVLFLLTVSLHLAVRDSCQDERLVRLAQEVALLVRRLEEVEQGRGVSPPGR